MAVRHGYGKIAGADALVFAYDTGDTRNSYKGEPTTNLTTDTPSQTGWMGTYSLIDSASKTFTITTQQNNAATTSAWRTWYWSVSTYIGSYVTISADVEFVSETNCNFLHLHMGQGNTGTYPYHIAGSDVADRVKIETKPIEKVHLTWSGIINSTGIVGFTQWIDNVTVNGANSVLRISNVQIEAKSHASPFTTGTRSATQGLLDLTGNSTIDLANVSFDSNAQMTFDGTNDYVDLGSYLTNLDTSTLSIELVFKSNTVTGDALNLIGWMTGESPHGYICTGNFTGMWGNESISFFNFSVGEVGHELSFAYTNGHSFLNDTNYHHVVFTLQNADYRIYVDGVQVAVNASFRNGSSSSPMTSNLFGYGSTPSVEIGAGSNPAYYANVKVPITKIYNRVLTADEVRNNYNQYRTRFNI